MRGENGRPRAILRGVASRLDKLGYPQQHHSCQARRISPCTCIQGLRAIGSELNFGALALPNLPPELTGHVLLRCDPSPSRPNVMVSALVGNQIEA